MCNGKIIYLPLVCPGPDFPHPMEFPFKLSDHAG